MQRRLSCLMKKLNLNEETVSALLMRSFPDFQRWMAGKEHGNDDYNDNDDDIEARVEFFLMSNALEDLVQQKDIAYTSLPVDALLVGLDRRIQETILWNVDANETTPIQFAAITAAELKLSPTFQVSIELSHSNDYDIFLELHRCIHLPAT
ncbi:hypothetical protein B5M09_006176 [Aphanomyces astaci]|uniref:Uncharacterized protein n=1 Tax=Aphanomyces astaci TaxID=112090 RepID=A0A425DQC2_APHAT|nr:hypothetical protein B5M09_006176 [Aphanomyces astaci]